MGNEERIRKWREGKGADQPQPPTDALSGTPAEAPDADLPPPGGRRIPTRREEQLADQARLREDIADSRLPGEEEIDREVAGEAERRRGQSRDVRRRLALFVGLPILLVAAYSLLFSPANYTSRSSFVVMTAGTGADAMPAVGLFGGSSAGAGLADAYRIREYLLSREAMQEMEKRHGFLTHFRQHTLDPFNRPVHLPVVGLDAHDFYKRKLSIAVDLREGIARISVDALSPDQAQRFANGLLTLARERTQSISDQLNADQFRALQNDVVKAEQDMRNASTNVAAIQRQRGVLDPAQSATAIYQLIGNLEVKRAEAQAERDSITASGLSESPLLPRLNAKIAELERQIAAQQNRIVGGGSDTVQSAAASLEMAVAKRRLAETSLESTLRTFEQAKLRSIEDRRYLVIVSAPVLPEKVQASRLLNLMLLTAIAALLIWGLVSTLRSSRYLRSIR